MPAYWIQEENGEPTLVEATSHDQAILRYYVTHNPAFVYVRQDGGTSAGVPFKTRRFTVRFQGAAMVARVGDAPAVPARKVDMAALVEAAKMAFDDAGNASPRDAHIGAAAAVLRLVGVDQRLALNMVLDRVDEAMRSKMWGLGDEHRWEAFVTALVPEFVKAGCPRVG